MPKLVAFGLRQQQMRQNLFPDPAAAIQQTPIRLLDKADRNTLRRARHRQHAAQPIARRVQTRAKKRIRQNKPFVPPAGDPTGKTAIRLDNLKVRAHFIRADQRHLSRAARRGPGGKGGAENVQPFHPEGKDVKGLGQTFSRPDTHQLANGVQRDRVGFKQRSGGFGQQTGEGHPGQHAADPVRRGVVHHRNRLQGRPMEHDPAIDRVLVPAPGKRRIQNLPRGCKGVDHRQRGRGVVRGHLDTRLDQDRSQGRTARFGRLP